MRTVGGFAFPEQQNREEALAWKPHFERRMLHHQVMCLAKTRIEGKWNAYCFPVPGEKHDDEEYLWETAGAKLPEDVARALFPAFEGVPYAP